MFRPGRRSNRYAEMRSSSPAPHHYWPRGRAVANVLRALGATPESDLCRRVGLMTRRNTSDSRSSIDMRRATGAGSKAQARSQASPTMSHRWPPVVRTYTLSQRVGPATIDVVASSHSNARGTTGRRLPPPPTAPPTVPVGGPMGDYPQQDAMSPHVTHGGAAGAGPVDGPAFSEGSSATLGWGSHLP